MNVKDAAKSAGTSVRTLRYYEEIGLISPVREENGYREYTQEDINRIKLIRAYREMQFSLEEIGLLLNASRMERDSLLQRKIEAMEHKRQQIDNRIALAQSIRMMGPERLPEINFSKIDDQLEQSRRYLNENPQMKALGDRIRGISQETGDKITKELIGHLACIANAPESEVGQAVQNLTVLVEKYFYPCNDKILLAYARAYGGDGILAQAVEEAGGEGAAKRLRTRLESQIKTGGET